jgi:hypothetical protein
MSPSPSTLLRKLEATRLDYGPGRPLLKLGFLAELELRSLNTANAVLRLHEHLCFLRAYPDNRAVQAQVVRMLRRFSIRADFSRYRAVLADTGIAGTVIHYRFFWPTALWIATRWPAKLEIDWKNIDDDRTLAGALPLLVTPLEANWLRSNHPRPQQALKRLSGTRNTDGTFFTRRVAVMPGDHVTREAFFDGLDIPFRLRSGPGTPSRTLTYYPRSPVVFRGVAPERARPNLLMELARPPRAVRAIASKEGDLLIDLARVAMVTRERDLDNFAYGDCRDVRIVDDGDGLQWIVIGTIPERRPILRATYGMLTIRNGVPIGYVGADALFQCVDISYNTFPTFRGGEAAFVFARMLATLQQLFGARAFTIEPYQLGDGNEEALESGAWWFYYKLGFRPRNPAIRTLVRREIERMKAKPGFRSTERTLRRLAKDYLYFEIPGVRAPYWPRVAEFGRKVAKHLAALGAASREDALRLCFEETKRRLDASPPRHATANILAAWRNWSAVIALLPGVEGWSREDRSHVARIMTAKGGHRESDYLSLFDAHSKLGPLLRRLTRA